MGLKKLTAFILAFVMVLSTSFSSYATGAGSSAGEGDTGNTGSTNNNGNGTWSVTANTGFRFTIVDGSGKPVSKILGREGVVSFDVVNDGVKNSGEFWTACATDTNQTMDAHGLELMRMSQFMDYIGESDHEPLYWLDATTKKSRGIEIREFILKGTNSVNTGSGAGGTGDENTENATEKSFITTSLAVLSDLQDKANSNITEKEAWEIINQISANSAPFSSAIKSVYEAGSAPERVQVGLWYDKATSIQVILNKNFPSIPAPSKNESDIIAGVLYKLFPWMSKGGTRVSSLKETDLFSLFGGITAYASPVEAKKEEANADTEVVLTGDSVLEKILNMSIDGYFVFQLDGAATELKAAQKGDGLYPAKVFIDKGYILLVEATIQGMPQEYGGDYTNYGSLVYGTAHNWAQFLQTPGWKKVYSGDSVGNSTKYINQYVTNGLVTVTDWFSPLGGDILKAPTHDGKFPNSEMINNFNVGYGCHIYTGLDLGGGEVVPYLDTGNPIPSEEKTEKDFIVNRFFRQKQKNGSYVYTKFDTHSYNIKSESRSVNINSSAEGSTLVEWGTSEAEKFIPDTTKSASEYTWETVAKKNTGTEKGNSSKLLEIKPDSKIQTINVLYC